MKLTIFIILKCVIQWHSVVGPPSLFAEHCIPTRRKCCIPIKWSFPIPSPSRSWQLLLCFLFLSICLFWIFYITGITWVCVCVRLACISTSFLLRAEQYSVAWICLPFMHCGHSGCCHRMGWFWERESHDALTPRIPPIVPHHTWDHIRNLYWDLKASVWQAGPPTSAQPWPPRCPLHTPRAPCLLACSAVTPVPRHGSALLSHSFWSADRCPACSLLVKFHQPALHSALSAEHLSLPVFICSCVEYIFH